MEGYDRMIAYISAYDGGIQNKTVGFVKMERWEDCLWLELHVKGIYGFGGAPLIFHALGKGERGFSESRIGKVPVTDGRGDFSCEEKQNEIGENALPFSRLCGFLLRPEGRKGERFFAAYWGEEPFMPEWFSGTGGQLPGQETLTLPAQETSVEAVLKVAGFSGEMLRTEPGQAEPWQMEPSQVEPRQMEPGQAESWWAEPVRTETGWPETGRPEGPMEDRFWAEELEKICPRQQPETPWQALCKCFPKEAMPGEGAGSMELLRIRPQDIGRLPRENWIYGSNSFLLHGYYQYRYLVLIRDGKSRPERYLLGVPGLYGSGEKQMASMFGFSEFLPVRAVEKNSCFGYWYTTVNIGNTEKVSNRNQ